MLKADTLDFYKTYEDKIYKRASDMNMSKIKDNVNSHKYIKNISKLYQELQPNIEKAKETMFNGEYKTIKTITVHKNKNVDKMKLSPFLENNRIYIFMSSSVPKNIWYEYGSIIDRQKIRNASLLLRGCIKGCERIMPTMNFLKSVIEYKPAHIINPLIYMDPLLFKKYNIDQVPCFVYAQNIKVLDYQQSEGIEKNVNIDKVYKSCGDWSFKYHIEELYKQSNDINLKQLLEKL